MTSLSKYFSYDTVVQDEACFRKELERWFNETSYGRKFQQACIAMVHSRNLQGCYSIARNLYCEVDKHTGRSFVSDKFIEWARGVVTELNEAREKERLKPTDNSKVTKDVMDKAWENYGKNKPAGSNDETVIAWRRE